MVVEPAAGRRHVTVTQRRTERDFAEQMRRLCDEWYPEAEVIRVVLDNLNTHTVGALYEAFAPEVARRLAAKLEFHYTPKHASWLNMAELELSVLARQCLGRRIPDAATLEAQVKAWQDARNREKVKINWCFKVADARKKLVKVYPQQTSAAVHYLWEQNLTDCLTHRRGSKNMRRAEFDPGLLYNAMKSIFRAYKASGGNLRSHGLRKRAITLTVLHTQSVDQAAQAIGIDPATARKYYLDANLAFDGRKLLEKMAGVLRPSH